jgi:hypothetical protein
VVGGQKAGHLDGAGLAGPHEGRQQVAKQQIGRGLRTHVHVVAHGDGLRREGQHVDRPAVRNDG